MFKKVRILVIVFVAAVVVASCGDYSKILKSTDYEFKHKKAIEYFESGDYVKAGALFQELVSIYRGTSKADQIGRASWRERV